MSNYLQKRQFKTTNELQELLKTYFKTEEFLLIETLYERLGITKYNFKDWKGSTNPKFKKWAEMIFEAKKRIQAHLVRLAVYGQTEKELKSTRVVKQTGKKGTTWEYNRASPGSLKSYLRSRFKDDWDKDTKDHDTSANITINFSNEGKNKVE